MAESCESTGLLGEPSLVRKYCVGEATFGIVMELYIIVELTVQPAVIIQCLSLLSWLMRPLTLDMAFACVGIMTTSHFSIHRVFIFRLL